MSTEPVGLTSAQMEQLRGELGIRRRRWPLFAAAAVIVLAAGGASGYAAGHAHPRTVVRTVTRVDHVTTVKTVTKVRTRTVTKTQTAGSGGSSTPCDEEDGTVVPTAGAATAGASGLTTCTLSIQPDVPASNGDTLVITAPDGTSNSYPLGAPSGG
jgi:hypothetical protein